jgi:uncharacterized membrane protein
MVQQSLSNLALATRGNLDQFASRPEVPVGTGLRWISLIFHGLFGLACLVALIVLIVYLVRAAKQNHSQPQTTPAGGVTQQADTSASALVILNERYARGEISEEDYLKMKKNLTE